MKTALFLSAVLTAASLPALADVACVDARSLKGYAEMTSAFTTKQYADFEARFKAFCGENSAKLKCTSETVSDANAEKRMREIADKCAEVFRVPSSKGESTLHLLTTIGSAMRPKATK